MKAIAERFWAKVDRRDDAECWEWIGARIPPGYGHLRRGGRNEGTVYAHVLAVELDGRFIPAGAEVHHKCRNRACVNPAHLEVVTTQEHGERHTLDACHRGHPRSEAYYRKSTGRIVCCNACKREARAAARAAA